MTLIVPPQGDDVSAFEIVHLGLSSGLMASELSSKDGDLSTGKELALDWSKGVLFEDHVHHGDWLTSARGSDRWIFPFPSSMKGMPGCP